MRIGRAYVMDIIKYYIDESEIFDNLAHIKFTDHYIGLFHDAFNHKSMLLKDPKIKTYENLEYLGDGVVHLILSDYIYERYPEATEGFMTKLRIKLECGNSGSILAKILGLQQFIKVYQVKINDKIMEDVFEAFVGAFYLTFKYKITKMFIISLYEKSIDISSLLSIEDNFKDTLLKYFHQMKWGNPEYTSKKKRNGYSYEFESYVEMPNGMVGVGSAKVKQQSEQSASRDALIKIGLIVDGIYDPDWIKKFEKEEVFEPIDETKKKISVFNPNNKLIEKKDIKDILINFGVDVSLSKINLAFFREALTHQSYVKKDSSSTKGTSAIDKEMEKKCVSLQKKSNERVRFLGDSIIHFLLGEYFYHHYSGVENEGFMTKMRCVIECSGSLHKIAHKSGIKPYVLISQFIELSYKRKNETIMSGAFEAFIGVLYLEFGIDDTRIFFVDLMKKTFDIEKLITEEDNYKDILLQIYHQNHWGNPQYEMIKEDGPGHAKIFTMIVTLGDQVIGKGRSKTKKRAEQLASRQACRILEEKAGVSLNK